MLPFSLHENKVNPHQRWLGDGELPTYEEVQKGHGILGWGGDPRVPGRHRESEEMQWCEPCTSPWPWVLAYNSALTSSSGHPVGLITMIPELCPPCHNWNMETASFKHRGHCFLTLEQKVGQLTPEKYLEWVKSRKKKSVFFPAVT